MNIPQQQFWIIWNPARGLPNFRHDSLSSAKNEAQRLAANNPGEQFHVLESVGTAFTRLSDWQEHYHQKPF